jgi:hypothetical protein
VSVSDLEALWRRFVETQGSFAVTKPKRLQQYCHNQNLIDMMSMTVFIILSMIVIIMIMIPRVCGSDLEALWRRFVETQGSFAVTKPKQLQPYCHNQDLMDMMSMSVVIITSMIVIIMIMTPRVCGSDLEALWRRFVETQGSFAVTKPDLISIFSVIKDSVAGKHSRRCPGRERRISSKSYLL